MSTRHIAIRLEGLVFSYRFNEADLETEMKKFGPVVEVMLLDEELIPDIAIVEFATAAAAAAAVAALDRTTRNIEGYNNITVRASLMTPDLERELLAKAHIVANGTDPFELSTTPAFTCRYILDAHKFHPEYSVIGRVVGVGGENVKSIFRETQCNVRCNGKQKSTDDPLHVRVSADSLEKFESGKKLTEQLIKETYDDYSRWCEKHYLPVPPIKLKVVEGSDVLRPLGRLAQYHFR